MEIQRFRDPPEVNLAFQDVDFPILLQPWLSTYFLGLRAMEKHIISASGYCEDMNSVVLFLKASTVGKSMPHKLVFLSCLMNYYHRYELTQQAEQMSEAAPPADYASG